MKMLKLKARIFWGMIVEPIRGGNRRFLLNTLAWPLITFLGVWFIFSLKAALITEAVFVVVFLGLVLVAVARLEKHLDIRLEPWPFRAAVNRDQIARLAAELTALGFVPAGIYRIAGRDLFIEGYARPDLKVYAAVLSGDENSDAYVEFGSDYADGSGYSVSGHKMREFLPRPDHLVLVQFPGRSVGELLGILLHCRPEYGLLDTPPENFQQSAELGVKQMRDFLFPKKRA